MQYFRIKAESLRRVQFKLCSSSQLQLRHPTELDVTPPLFKNIYQLYWLPCEASSSYSSTLRIYYSFLIRGTSVDSFQ